MFSQPIKTVDMQIVSYLRIREVLFLAIDEIVNLRYTQHFNERYLHHFFSHEIQKDVPLYFSSQTQLHPEWATYRRGNVSYGGKYKKYDSKYKIDDHSGTSGFIDFAIGDIEKPYFAIEFKMSDSFDKHGVAYDYLKLLDKKNPFSVVVSFVVYYGLKSKSRAVTVDKLNGIFNSALGELKKGRFDNNREYYFFVVEVNQTSCIVYERCNKDESFHITSEYRHDC